MPTMRQKIEKYEHFLHQLNMAASITMDKDRVAELIDQACRWSYAHRIGNGELTDAQQQRIVNAAFDKLGEQHSKAQEEASNDNA